MSDAGDTIEVRVKTVGRAMPQTEIKIASRSDRTTRGAALRPAGRSMRARLRADEGLRRRSRGHGAGDPARRLAADRRPGSHARGRLHPHHRPLARRDHPRRRKHLSARSGGVPLHPPQGGRGAGDRHSQRAAGRDRGRVGAARPGRRSAHEEEIREFCQGQIAYYKIPAHVRFVTEFPATLSGKIQKYKMREFEIEARGLQAWRGRRWRSAGCINPVTDGAAKEPNQSVPLPFAAPDPKESVNQQRPFFVRGLRLPAQ